MSIKEVRTENNKVINLNDFLDFGVYSIPNVDSIGGEYQLQANYSQEFLDDQHQGYVGRSETIASFKNHEDAEKACEALNDFREGKRSSWAIEEFK